MLLHSSSGAGDCMWVYCCVMIDVYALASCLLALHPHTITSSWGWM